MNPLLNYHQAANKTIFLPTSLRYLLCQAWTVHRLPKKTHILRLAGLDNKSIGALDFHAVVELTVDEIQKVARGYRRIVAVQHHPAEV